MFFFMFLEEDFDWFIGEYFDLIVGMFMGGILVIGLVMGFFVCDFFDFYVCCGLYIFG